MRHKKLVSKTVMSKTLALIQQKFTAQYEVTSTIRHRGEKGRQREHGLSMLLREHLPMAYGVGTGEIIPYVGMENSPQCDIIVYDQLRFPILGRNDPVQLIPLEAVYAVIETKTTLDARELKDAENKFRAIQAMPRCPPTKRLRKGMQREPVFIVFAYKLAMNIHDVIDRVAIDDPGFMVVTLNDGICLPINDRGTFWVHTTNPAEGRYETLVAMYTIMLSIMQNIDLGVPDYGKLIPLS